MSSLNLTVLVPTYRRPQDLARCLAALRSQTRSPDEVLITVRDTDVETTDFLQTLSDSTLPLRILTVTVPGVIAAMNLGFASATGDIISITDDDAAPHPDWLERIEQHFLADDRLGGLGGRDWMYVDGTLIDASNHPGASQVVGRLQWFGRHIGNHHIGEGERREVDILKGVNMSFRRTALAGLQCDERLKGTGAQVHFEIALSLSVKQRGWKLIYDPAVAVNHYPAQRFDEDQRHTFSATAWLNKVHNETLALLDHLSSVQRLIFLTWAILVGTRDGLGLVQWLRFLPDDPTMAGKKFVASLQGRWQGWCTWRKSHKLTSSSNQSLS